MSDKPRQHSLPKTMLNSWLLYWTWLAIQTVSFLCILALIKLFSKTKREVIIILYILKWRFSAGDKRSLASSSQQVLNNDDEEFLRAILNGDGGAKIKPLSTVGGDDQKDAALLAAFLKAQGIEPSTPSVSRYN